MTNTKAKSIVSEIGAFESAVGLYWYCVHHHSGMFSQEYRVQCKLQSEQGLRCSDSTEVGSDHFEYDENVGVELVYNSLVEGSVDPDDLYDAVAESEVSS